MTTTAGKPLIHASHQPLGTAVTEWLERAALPWPGDFELELELVERLPELNETRETITQPGIRFWAGPPDGSVRVRWDSHPAEAIVDPEQPRARIIFTPDAAAHLEEGERGFLLVVLLYTLRRLGWFHLHAAALNDPQGRGWLFVGASHSGKSTTSALLARNGWSVSTDDIGFLTSTATGDTQVIGYRDTIALREGGQSLLNTIGGIDHQRRAKSGFLPEELGGCWISSIRPERIIFPAIGPSTSLSPIPTMEVFKGLIASSPWVLAESKMGQTNLDVLSQLARQAKGYRATFGTDLIENPNLLQELIT